MKTVRWAGIALLFFLSTSAIMGSLPMIANPRGEPWRMPQSLLQHSPFSSFLGPGIILLVANGILAAWALWRAFSQAPHYERWMIFQGFVLLGWLAVECLLLRLIVWPHYLYAAVAAALVLAGLILWRSETRSVGLRTRNSFGDGI